MGYSYDAKIDILGGLSMSAEYNPDFDPTGIEGGVDTNQLPWIRLACAPNWQFKPLRASRESGRFSAIVKMDQGVSTSDLLHLGAMDLLILSGKLSYQDGPLASRIGPGVWGYVPANACVAGMTALEDTEFLANFYGPVAFLSAQRTVLSLLTAMDLQSGADAQGITLVPNTLAECMQPRDQTARSAAVPRAIAGSNAGELVDASAAGADFVHPHFVDTRAIPWIVDPTLPDIALKVLRVSEETGVSSLIVRHNGVAGPHYHLGAADFLVLNGHIGDRAGPPEGYGPGVWFFEPAGARHEATQRVGDHEDLIYTANVYGPIQFDDGPGTPIAAVQSWMQYKQAATAFGIQLVANQFESDPSLLAWAPVGSAV
jgi:hypothetical protein